MDVITSSPMALVTVLSEKNSVAVLVFLLDCGGSSKSTPILEAIQGNYSTLSGSIRERLEDAGLVTVQRTTGKSPSLIWSLTDLGTRVAMLLRQANELVEDAMADVPVDEMMAAGGGAKLPHIDPEKVNKGRRRGGGGAHLLSDWGPEWFPRQRPDMVEIHLRRRGIV